MTSRRKTRPAERWEPLREITGECSDEFLRELSAREGRELTGVWQSPLYEVYSFRCKVPEWPGGEVTWLSVKRRRKDHVRDWRHLQRIKTEICGPDREAVELFPAESRHVDTSNQYHLWVLAEGYRFPFGYEGRAIVKARPGDDRCVPGSPRQRPFEPGLEPADAMSPEEAVRLVHGGGP